MVETVGVEPTSENLFTGVSPSAVIVFLFPRKLPITGSDLR